MIYHIWCEGFKFSLDECARAHYIGFAEGKDFREAVLKWYSLHPSINFNAETLSDWGCRLFPTEEEARKSFG